eukprot:COSAG01_NODE_1866_length_9033_cov_5.018359_1_plen_89_part_00
MVTQTWANTSCQQYMYAYRVLYDVKTINFRHTYGAYCPKSGSLDTTIDSGDTASHTALAHCLRQPAQTKMVRKATSLGGPMATSLHCS